MHLTALVQAADHVCCRYRISAFRSWLKDAGHSLELVTFPRRPWGWFQLGRQLPSESIVIVQRRLLATWQIYFLCRHGRRLILDFDDAVFHRDSYSPRGLHDSRRERAFRRTVRAAAAVSAGNDFLRQRAVQAGCRGHASLIPTCVDVERYPFARHERTGAGVELAWIGSASTLQGLERIRPLLENIGRHCPGLCLRLICDRFLEFEHLSLRACPWTEASEAADLAAADIGISWLPDDLWSQGKCGLKVIQFMAAGLPVVANPIGVQPTLIQHGVTGFLVETDNQWLDAISRLAQDANLRRHMGAAGRAVVEREYSVSSGAAKWLALLEDLSLDRSPAAAA